MMPRKLAAVDRLRANVISQDEARRLEREDARGHSASIDQIERAWADVQATSDTKPVMMLAELLKLAGFDLKLQRVQYRAIAFAEANEKEPCSDWRYPGLSASKSKAKEHAATMAALASILLGAIEGRKPATITKALKDLRCWERVSWESLRGELLFCDHLPIEPLKVNAVHRQDEPASKSDWGKRSYELHERDGLSWKDTHKQMSSEGFKASVGTVRNLHKKYIDSQE